MRPLLIKTTVAAVLPAGLFAGCASVPRDAGFAAVKSEVALRTGQRIQWNARTADDRDAANALRQLLAQGLDADRAVQIALLNNRRLQATYEDLGVAQAEVVQAGLLKNPVFDGDLKFSTDGGGTKVELAVVQDFLDVFVIPLRKRVGEDRFESAKLRVTSAVLDLAGQVRVAFYAYEGAEQVLQLRRTVAQATEASYDLARRLHDAGNVTDLEFVNQRAMYEQQKLDLARAETAALNTRERLNVLLGLWGSDTGWTAPNRLPEPPNDDEPIAAVERRAVEKSLDLASARREVEAAARTLGIRRSFGMLPEAELGAAAERETNGEWLVGPAFSLPIPLFDQGQAATAKAASELERARQQFFATAVEVRAAARSARNDLLAARSRVNYYQSVILPLRRQVTEQTQLQYNAMQVGPFQLLQAKQTEIDAGVQYIQALNEYWLARTQLGQITSGRMTELGQSGMNMMGSASSASAGGRDVGGH
jgi:cobalt-zinc-cadmium efflux system outer membrane protein